jgi:hypothetical protein
MEQLGYRLTDFREIYYLSVFCRKSVGGKFKFNSDQTRITGTSGEELLTLMLIYQYSETNVMQFLFNLLRIKGLYMFRALLAHLQEALQKRHLVYCVCVMSVGCSYSSSQLT